MSAIELDPAHGPVDDFEVRAAQRYTELLKSVQDHPGFRRNLERAVAFVLARMAEEAPEQPDAAEVIAVQFPRAVDEANLC